MGENIGGGKGGVFNDGALSRFKKEGDGFKIWNSLDNLNWSLKGIVGPNTTTFTDSSLSTKTLYYYKIEAYNAFGSSTSVISSTTTCPCEVWRQTKDLGSGYSEYGFSLTLYGASTVYVTGGAYKNVSDEDMYLWKSVNGGPLNTFYAYAVADVWEEGRGVAVDSQGNVYSSGDRYYNLALFKVSPSGGAPLWLRSYDSGSSDFGIRIAADNTDNIWMIGFFWNGTDYDLRLLKYSSSGTLLINKIYDSGFGTVDKGYTVAIDSNGNVIVVGQIGYWSLLLFKYDNNGSTLWQTGFGGSGEYGRNYAGVAIGADDSIYVTGGYGGMYSILKWSPNGNLIWDRTYSDLTYDESYSIDIDSNGNLYICGESNDATYGYAKILKFDPNGFFLWDFNLGSGACFDVKVDSNFNVYATGQTWNGTDYDAFLIKLSQ